MSKSPSSSEANAIRPVGSGEAGTAGTAGSALAGPSSAGGLGAGICGSSPGGPPSPTRASTVTASPGARGSGNSMRPSARATATARPATCANAQRNRDHRSQRPACPGLLLLAALSRAARPSPRSLADLHDPLGIDHIGGRRSAVRTVFRRVLSGDGRQAAVVGVKPVKLVFARLDGYRRVIFEQVVGHRTLRGILPDDSDKLPK